MATLVKEWTQLLSSTVSDKAFSVSASDGIYIAGRTLGDLDGQTNSGSYDAVLSKFSSNGSKVWTRLLGSTSLDKAFSVDIAGDAIYIAGRTEGDLDGQINSGKGDAFLSKYDSDGSKEWTRLLGSSSEDKAFSVSTSSDGSIYIAGKTKGNLDEQTNNGNYDAFLSKYDSDGSKEWTRLLGSSSEDKAFSVSTAGDAIFVAGRTEGDLDGQINSGQGDAFLSKYFSDGTRAWTKLLGSSSNDDAHSISISSDGLIYITGVTEGNLDEQTNNGEKDIFLSKYNSDGNKIWTQLLGSSSDDKAFSVSTAGDAIYIAGRTEGDLDNQINSGFDDAFVSRYNTDGSRKWTRLLGSSSADKAYSVSATNKEVYITGITSGNLDEQTNSGSDDIFISKYKYDYPSIPPEEGCDDSIPIAINLSAISFSENIAPNSPVTTLSTSESSNCLYLTEDTFVYSLISGNGDIDNSAFTIAGDQLKIIDSPDYETKSSYSIRLQSKDSDSLILEKEFTLEVNDLNEAPIELSISASTLDENLAGGAAVATLSTSDPDAGDTHTYSLISGNGDTDNSAFTIAGDQLKIIDSPDYETKSSYSIRLQSKDSDSLILEKEFTLEVNDLNEVPIELSISASTLDENLVGGAVVATLGTSDPDAGDTHTYSLISGNGDTDNSAFTIAGDQLKIIDSPDYEIKSSYSIRLQSKDSDGLILEKEFTLEVNDLNEAPIELSITASTLDENLAGGAAVATLSTSDPDAGDTHTYSLISGNGDTDNSAFTIDGDQLKIVESPDYETKSSHSVRLQSKDSGGLILEKEFTLTVNNFIDIPNPDPTEEDSIEQIESIDSIKTPHKVSTYKLSDPITIRGQDIDTVIIGTKNKDKITGSSSREILAGAEGKDTLKGRGGADGYLFHNPEKFGKKDADKIKGFDPDEGDAILVDKKVFNLGKKIKLKVVTGKKASNKASKSRSTFVYDDLKGVLYFNENGKAKGWGDGGMLVTLKGAPNISEDEFTILAQIPTLGSEPTPESNLESQTYKQPSTKNTIRGTKKDDKINGTNKSNLIIGKKGNDKLTGLRGDDILRGASGKDNLNGSKGNDYLHGNKGLDILKGGKGADVFQISKGTNIVQDFSIQQGDRIALTKKGNYKIIDASDAVLIKSSSKKQLILLDTVFDDVITEGVNLFVQPI